GDGNSDKEERESFLESLSQEKQLLQQYADFILQTDTSNIIMNWQESRYLAHKNGTTLISTNYPITNAIALLNKFNIPNIFDTNLAQFAYSLSQQEAKTFTFSDRDEVSLTILLLSSEYDNSIIYYNKLIDVAKKKFRKALEDVFYDMGLEFIPVVITDGYRTMDEQAERVYKRGCQYYMQQVGVNSLSYPYLETLKNIYENKQDMETVLVGSLIPQGAKNEIRKYKGDLLKTLKALIDEYFNPSKHTIGQSLDIRIRDNHYTTANLILNKLNKGYLSNDHIHLNLD
ncbi:MAG: hypothetical protein ACRC0X_07560, partial [Brevinema sp.]